jgi:DNA-binding LacI/PurR family transcriptional regulator
MVTLKQVAERSGVSISTVSRVMNGHTSVAGDIRTKVLRAARELDYQPNRLARSLKSARSNILGLLLPNMVNPFFPIIAEAVEETANQRGYQIMLGTTHWKVDKENQYLRILEQVQADGIVLLPGTDNVSKALLEKKYVLLDKGITGHPFVRTDNQKGIVLAVNHLADMGHTRLALLGNTTDVIKLAGFRDGLAERYLEMDPTLIFDTGLHTKGGAVERLLQEVERRNRPPTAVVAFSDTEAVRLLVECQRRGIRVASDLAIVGYDNTFLAEISDLTSVAQPQRELARIATDMLIDLVEEVEVKNLNVVLEPRLVVRRTTGGRV